MSYTTKAFSIFLVGFLFCLASASFWLPAFYVGPEALDLDYAHTMIRAISKLTGQDQGAAANAEVEAKPLTPPPVLPTPVVSEESPPAPAAPPPAPAKQKPQRGPAIARSAPPTHPDRREIQTDASSEVHSIPPRSLPPSQAPRQKPAGSEQAVTDFLN